MEEKFDILDALSKRPKPDLPTDFFTDFSSSLMNEIDSNSELIKGLEKTKSSPVPADFFENFSSDLMSKIKDSETAIPIHSSKRNILSMKVVGFVSAVAACLLVFFLLNLNTESEVAVVNESETEIETQTIADEDYLAYLDEADLVDFLIENEDIELENELSAAEEDMYYLFDEEIEEIYLEEL